MNYHLTVRGYTKGLNLVLSGFHYNQKTRRFFNPVKEENDRLCIWAIRSHKKLRNTQITKPIVLHYKFYWRDMRSDRMNIFSAFDKSFEDALQKVGVLKNDGWNDVINTTADFEIDKKDPRVEVIIEELETPVYNIFNWKSLGL